MAGPRHGRNVPAMVTRVADRAGATTLRASVTARVRYRLEKTLVARKTDLVRSHCEAP